MSERQTWIFSPGHAGVSGNERADSLAGTAAIGCYPTPAEPDSDGDDKPPNTKMAPGSEGRAGVDMSGLLGPQRPSQVITSKSFLVGMTF